MKRWTILICCEQWPFFFSSSVTENKPCTTLGKPFACRSTPPGGRTNWIASRGRTWWVLVVVFLLNRLMFVSLPPTLGLGSGLFENVINMCCFFQNLMRRLELAKPTPSLARSQTLADYQRQMVYAQLRLLPSVKKSQRTKTPNWLQRLFKVIYPELKPE